MEHILEDRNATNKYQAYTLLVLCSSIAFLWIFDQNKISVRLRIWLMSTMG